MKAFYLKGVKINFKNFICNFLPEIDASKKPIIRCWTETSLLVFTKDLKWEGQNGDLKFSPLFPTLD